MVNFGSPVIRLIFTFHVVVLKLGIGSANEFKKLKHIHVKGGPSQWEGGGRTITHVSRLTPFTPFFAR